MLDWFGMHGSRPDRIIELGSCAAITGCAAAGMGVAAVPESWLAALGEESLEAISIHPLPESLSRANVECVRMAALDTPVIRPFEGVMRRLGA